MKKIFCPKCDGVIILSHARLREIRESQSDRAAIVCPSCGHQLRIRLRSASSEPQEQGRQASTGESLGHIVVLENVFGYKQLFPLYLGLNRIGRRNKDTQTDIPIITGDPSMDRHHAIIKVMQRKGGGLSFALSDDDSRVGTFVAGRLLAPREWCNLETGDVFTLGATSVIFSSDPLPSEDEEQVEQE